MIETFLIKIATAVFKKAVVSPLLVKALGAYEICSTFQMAYDCVQSANDCHDLNVCGLKVVSDIMPIPCVERLIDVGKMRFKCRKSDSGIYLASPITKPFLVSGLTLPMIQQNTLSLPLGFAQSSLTIPKLKKDTVMADTIIVRCAYCGFNIGEVSFIPGTQIVGCSKCNRRTKVEIEKDGTLEIYPWE